MNSRRMLMKRHPRTCIPNLFHGKENLNMLTSRHIFQKEMPKEGANSLLTTVQVWKNSLCYFQCNRTFFFSICGLKINEKCTELILPNVTYFIEYWSQRGGICDTGYLFHLDNILSSQFIGWQIWNHSFSNMKSLKM